MQPASRIDVLDLFVEERAALLSLLESLHADDWGLPTVCDGWSVKDIAAHILGDDLGGISRGRDGYMASWIEPSSWDELVQSINNQNELWVSAMRRLSPRVITDLLRVSAKPAIDQLRSRDLDEIGPAVDWVGPQPGPQWMHVAREYTEYWAHQQQIRDAIGKPGLKDRRMYHPVLDAYVRALPHTFRDVLAPEGAHVRLRITGEAGDVWSLVRQEAKWDLYTGVGTEPTAGVSLDQDEAWRLFTRGIAPEAARAWCVFEGDAALAAKVLDAVGVIA
jgi:uncharacterized protein (TIGR03083 family)